MKITVEKVFIFQLHAANLRQKNVLMTDTRKQQESTALVLWTYSLDEWNNFLNWKKKKNGLFQYFLYRFFSRKIKRTPEITISETRVGVDNVQESFHDSRRRLRRVSIHDAGSMNVMKICYHAPDLPQKGPFEINILVPKGKLREAIQLQDKLTATLNV